MHIVIIILAACFRLLRVLLEYFLADLRLIFSFGILSPTAPEGNRHRQTLGCNQPTGNRCGVQMNGDDKRDNGRGKTMD